MFENTKAIIDTSQPFRGVSSILLPDDTVAYTDGLTLDEYREQNKDERLEVITWEEFDKLNDQHLESLKTKPQKIDEKCFDEFLSMLPPCRWHNCGGYEVFHMSERLTGNIVTWFAHKDNDYWTFDEADNISDEKLVKILNAYW